MKAVGIVAGAIIGISGLIVIVANVLLTPYREVVHWLSHTRQ